MEHDTYHGHTGRGTPNCPLTFFDLLLIFALTSLVCLSPSHFIDLTNSTFQEGEAEACRRKSK